MQLIAISTALLCLSLVVSHSSGGELSSKIGAIPFPGTIGSKIKKPISIVEIKKPQVIKVPIIEKIYIDKKVPAPFPVPSPYPVPVPRPKQVPVPRGYPSPVVVPVARAVPVRIPFPVPIFIRVPVPAPFPVPRRVPSPVPVRTPVKYPVAIPTPVAVPVGVAKLFTLGQGNYYSPGWGALGLRGYSDYKGLAGPLTSKRWQSWAKQQQLDTLSIGSKFGNLGLGSEWNTRSFESLGNLGSLSKGLGLYGLKGQNSLASNVVISKSSKSSKKVKTSAQSSSSKKILLQSSSS